MDKTNEAVMHYFENDRFAALNRLEKILVIILRLDALLLLSALVPSMMPLAWMQNIHCAMGLGDLPAGPIVAYLTRSLSMMYALHGATLLYLSFHIRRFLPVVRFLVLIGIVFGLWMTALDVAIGMPLFWIVGEGPLIFLMHCVFYWFTGQVEFQRPAGTESRL